MPTVSNRVAEGKMLLDLLILSGLLGGQRGAASPTDPAAKPSLCEQAVAGSPDHSITDPKSLFAWLEPRPFDDFDPGAVRTGDVREINRRPVRERQRPRLARYGYAFCFQSGDRFAEASG